MAATLIPKKSTISGRVPTSQDLALGEICLNHADRLLFARHPVTGAIQSIGGSGGAQADWSATSGAAQILNKPTLGTAASANSSDFATAAQGTKADTASQPGHTHALSDLTQSSATSGQVPTWSGTAWVAQTPAAGGVTSVAGRTGAITLTTSDISGLSAYVKSDTTGVANSTQLSNMLQITQAGYNAITPNANTLYVIVG